MLTCEDRFSVVCFYIIILNWFEMRRLAPRNSLTDVVVFLSVFFAAHLVLELSN